MLLDTPLRESAAVHLTSEELAAYLDRSLPAGEHQRVEGHLAECAECRSEAVEVTRVLQSKPRDRRWWMIGAAAAAVLLFALVQPLTRSDSPRPDSLRATDRPSAVDRRAGVATVAPSVGALVDPSSVVFAWRSAGVEVLYRLAVTDAEGTAVWTDSTSDTVLALPRTVALRRGQTYYWYVDALHRDGSSATTGVHRFLTPR
jgi:hypothetical protein